MTSSERSAAAAADGCRQGSPAGGSGAFKPQLHMIRRTLDNLPALVLPTGCSIRCFRDGWEKKWERIITESFEAQPGTYDFEKVMRADPSFRPERILFACFGEEPAAVAAAYSWPHKLPGGMLHYVGALKSHRGMGLGRAVSLAALYRMKEDGFTTAWLSTDDFRLPAIKTYLDLGFVPLLVHENQRARWAAVFEKLGRPGLIRDFSDIMSGAVLNLGT